MFRGVGSRLARGVQLAMEQWILWALSIVCALFIGGFLKSYMAKKGENRAIREDIAELTRLTKEIEHTVSTKAWARQIRKEATFDAIKSLARVDAAVSSVLSQHNLVMGEFKADKETRDATLAEFKIAYESLFAAKLLVEVACGNALAMAFDVFRVHSLNMVDKAIARDWDDIEANIEMSGHYVREIGVLVRESIGIEL
jgi:hypothetical protein